MTRYMCAEPCLEATLSADFFQYLVAGGVARYGEYLVVPCQAPVLLYYLSGNIQQADIGFGIGLLSSGDNPQVAVKECLQVVGGQVLHIGICQTRENRKDEHIPHKFIVGVFHRYVHKRLYLRFGKIPPVHAFGELIYPAKGLNGRRPSFLAIETMCFNTII